MTALDHRPASDTDEEMQIFDAATLEYVSTHRHQEPAPALARSARRAALRAVIAHRDDRDRHPDRHDHSDLALTTDVEHKRQLAAAGWTPLGVCGPVYVLRPPSTDQAAPVDGAR